MGKSLEVNCKQGQKLLWATTWGLPQKFNDQTKFTLNDRSTHERNNRQLLKSIKRISPGFQARPKMLFLFGDLKNWKELPKKTITVTDPGSPGGSREIVAPGQGDESDWEMVNPYKVETLELTGQARDAVSMSCVLMCHPDSPHHISPAAQEELVIPIAEQLRIVPWLDEKIGISQSNVGVVYNGGDEEAEPSDETKEEAEA